MNVNHSVYFKGLMLCLLFTTGCATEQKSKRKNPVDFASLKQEAQQKMASKKAYEACEVLNNALSLYPDHKEISDIHLMLGDLYFDQKEYADADKEYRLYLKMNPTRGEYASYRSILSSFYQTLKLDRDPTPLAKTIKRCKKHLSNQVYSLGNTHQDVRDILYTAEKKLIDREVYTFNFYLENEKYASAENRLKELQKHVDHHKDLNARILYLKARLNLQRNNIEDAQAELKNLYELYPESQYTEMTQQMLVHNENKKFGRFLF